jgi:hypothetical protein
MKILFSLKDQLVYSQPCKKLVPPLGFTLFLTAAVDGAKKREREKGESKRKRVRERKRREKKS